MNLPLFLCLSLLYISIYANFYFSTSDTRVHSYKDINNFEVNLYNLKLLIANLTIQHQFIPNFFNNIHTPTRQRQHFQNYLSKNNRSATISSMIHETHALLFDCIDNLNGIYDKASYNYQNAINPPTSNHHRSRRGIPVIGDIIRWVSSEPSPEMWHAHFSMERDLSKLIKGNIIPGMGRLVHVIETHQETFDSIIPIVNELQESEMQLDNLFDLILDIIRDDQYLLRICLKGESSANRVLNDSIVLKNIHESALRNQPDPFLFPAHFLNDHIGSYKLDSKLDPFSEDPHQIRTLETAITIIENNHIHGLLLIPCINRSFKFKFLEHPILSSEDTLTLRNLETHAMKSIDIFGCNVEKQSILIFSSKDISFSCKRWSLALTYICFKRQILLKTDQNPCDKFNLKNSLAIELSPTLVLLKTSLSQVYMDCNNFPHTIVINATFSKIFLPTSCGLRGYDFEVSSYPSSTTMESLDPETISIIPLETVENLLLSNIKENISKIWTHHTNMSHDITSLANDNNIAKNKINELVENSEILASNFDTTPPQHIFLYTAVPFLIICMFTVGICYCKKRRSYSYFFNPGFFAKPSPMPEVAATSAAALGSAQEGIIPPCAAQAAPAHHAPAHPAPASRAAKPQQGGPTLPGAGLPPKFSADSAQHSPTFDEEGDGNNWKWQ